MTTTTKIRKQKDTDELVSGVRRQIKALERRAATEDPWCVQDMLDLRDELDAAAVRTVARLRAAGYRWADISYSLGITPTTCVKRYARKIEGIDPAYLLGQRIVCDNTIGAQS